MNLILFSSFIAVSCGALLPTSYLPANPSGLKAQGSGFHSQSFQSSQSSTLVGGGVSADTDNRRPQQEVEKDAAILKLDQDANENGEYHYSYETSNGIRAEESGNTVQSQGGFSYKGDDGITYTVTFTAGEAGFRPLGAHLPVAPPIPDDILKGLQQNERDEAAGIFDDGKYHPEKHGVKAKAGNANVKFSGASVSFGSANRQGSFNANTGYSY